MNNMKRISIFAAVMACLLLVQQIIYATPLYEQMLSYFAHHSLRFELYRAFWMVVRIALVGCFGWALYNNRRRLPMLQKGHTWFTLILAMAFTVPVIWSIASPNYADYVTFCYSNSYLIIALWALLAVWFILLARTNYEEFASEPAGMVGLMGAFTSLLILILGAHSFWTFFRHHFSAGWHSEALISWLLPSFFALVLWIYGLANLRKS